MVVLSNNQVSLIPTRSVELVIAIMKQPSLFRVVGGSKMFQVCPDLSIPAQSKVLVTSDLGVQPAGDWRWSITWCLPARKKNKLSFDIICRSQETTMAQWSSLAFLSFLHLHWVDLEKNFPISTSPKNPPAWTSDFAATRSHQRLQRSRLKGWSILASYKIL